MGLLTILKKVKLKEKEMRILMLGLDNAGKTTIVKKFNNEDINTISPTLGFNIQSLQYKEYTLNIWDVGGQQTLRSYWRNYFEQTDALIWVVDSHDETRLGDCKRELAVLLQEEKLAGATLLIFMNKQDLPSALPKEKIIDLLSLRDLSGNRHINIVGCSAVTGQGLEEGIDWVVQDIASRIYID
ncbi:ADP-ribosylation factor-like protein 2 [Diplonema papillatum]|nr:ADP-ribosylation factor-like protein 2 [Diplonema papillatum]